MPWHITEVSSQDEDSLSDEELVQLYTLVSYGSATYHREIAKKLEPVAKLAQHNLLQVHRWENDGGATHKEETK
jgi:hypothetical protein